MDKLPLETLQRIFEFACTDGGRTGCALALTSRGVRAAAHTTRFHSTALVAYPATLAAFVALYNRECAPPTGDKARIAHLHLTFPHFHSASRPPSPVSGSRARAPRPTKLDGTYLDAVRTLLRAAAPDLRSLVIQYGSLSPSLPHPSGDTSPESPDTDLTPGAPPCSLPILPLSTSFPRLRDLTLMGVTDLRTLLLVEPSSPAELDDGSEHPHPNPPQRQSQSPLLPALTRVHLVLPISSAPNAHAHGALLPLAQHAPRLAHLRISRLAPGPHTLTLLHELADAVADPVPRLQTVVLEPCALPDAAHGGWRGDPVPKERYTEMWCAVRRVERATRPDDGEEVVEEVGGRRRRVEVRVLDGVDRTHVETARMVRRSWERRVAQDGEEGEDEDEIVPAEEEGRGRTKDEISIPMAQKPAVGRCCYEAVGAFARVGRREAAETQTERPTSGWRHTTIFYAI